MIKNEKFPGYCFYMNTNIKGHFQICISVSLTNNYWQVDFTTTCTFANHVTIIQTEITCKKILL